ncbi:TonB-dependent receptor [Parapedobacter sp. SGR-10]|uniref:SusC/RagA family TonB-linked outer membrane protein n=1 Tax=Parapedobacter sp. SGR-10 TaxID=2710879 RepID=UPI0013D30B20|nr:TonB-dependent receptor [Parapedobacter sp. SGR-10]NGF57736.1 TonB-dependent receptor [Parapedobacter sp. SGR-10]
MKKRVNGVELLKMILLMFMVFASQPIFSQTSKAIKGVVYDGRSGEPLQSVTVRVKGKNTVTTTGSNGRFGLSVGPKDVLLFSLVGYEEQEVSIGNRASIIVNMELSTNSLQEVVVVGYGTQKREDLTGSVGIVNVEQMAEAPVMSFDQALAGRIAGVEVNLSDGQPGEEGTGIVIRGAGSLTQDISPLFVVDGFPNEHFDPNSLNMDDIESINVLKDASAIAIYGARAAGGVIVIETKKGRIGKPQVSYRASFGMQDIVQSVDVMDPYEFVRYQIDRNNGAGYLTEGRTLEDYRNVKGIDWQDKVLRTGKTHIHQLAIRGGSEGTNYSLSGSVFNNNGIIINTGQDRYQGRFALTQKIDKRADVGINLNYSSRSSYGSRAAAGGAGTSSQTAYLLFSLWGYRPVTTRIDFDEDDLVNDILDDDIDFLNDYRVNPVLDAQNEYNKRLMNDLVSNAHFSYKIGRYLTFKAQGSINTRTDNREYFYNSQTRRGNEINPQNVRGQWGGKSWSERLTWSNENILTYKRAFEKKHNVEGMLGFSNQKSSSKSGSFVGINSPDESLGIDGLGQAEAYTIAGTSSQYTLSSFFGRANYNYRSKYLFTATLRADGSSRFPKKNQWGYFPSGAFAWQLKRESFMKDIKEIHNAKVRVSWGMTGNNRVSDFAPYDIMSFQQSGSYSWGNDSPIIGAVPARLGNPDLKWEATEQFDIGLDLSLLKNKVEFVFDWYSRTTHDLLLNANMPRHTGYNTVFKNIGALRNRGLEFTLTTQNVRKKNFRWESNFNITFNRNEVLSLTEGENIWLETVSWHNSYTSIPLYITEVGQPAGQMYGYIWEGNYQYEDFVGGREGDHSQLLPGIPANNATEAAVQPGDIKYRDLNGDGIIDDSDRTIIGRGTPIHTGGFYNSVQYMGVRLGVLLQWVWGRDVFNANRMLFEGGSTGNLNQFASYADRWTPDYQTNEHYRAGGWGPGGRYSSKTIEDGSFLRLKTIELGYSVPKKYLDRYRISGLTLNVQAQNLLTWSNYTGFDPEVSVRNSVLTPSFDFSAYPQARTVVFGARLNF